MKLSSLILDLLRTYGSRGTSVQDIAATGALFGFSENRVRVSLSRLVARGTVEKPARGQYRLCETTDPVNAFAERWRLGEARVRPWQNTWLAVHVPASCRDDRHKWPLSNFGLVQVEDNFWIRADNLAEPDIDIQLDRLGVPAEAILVREARLSEEIGQHWLRHFDVQGLDRRYTEMTQKLQHSLQVLPQLPMDEAKRESFELGGQAIELLAKDPLLPESLLNPIHRKTLWATMMDYDKAGRAVWATRHLPDTTPMSQTQFETNEINL